jgi:hypothetical protein
MRGIEGTNEADNDPTRDVSAPSHVLMLFLIGLAIALLGGLMVAIAMLTSR